MRVGVEADWVLEVLDVPTRGRRRRERCRDRLFVLNREIGFRHGLRCGCGSRRGFAFGARERFGRVAVHRVGIQQAGQPLDFLFVFPVPLRQLGEAAESDDVLAVQSEDVGEDAQGRGVVLLVDEAAGVDDVGADVIGVELEAVLAEIDGVIYKPCFTIGVRQGGKVSALGVIPKARFELVDLAGVGHA